ncbi:MAG: heme-binding protein, partial [Methylocystis sp.]
MKRLTTTALLFLATAGVAIAQNVPAPGGAPQQPAAGGAPQNPPPPPARGPALDLAIEAAQAAIEASKAGDQKVAVSVIDSAGVLKAVLVSDGVGPRAVQNSNFKAQAALA